jgi:pimeloyl-ACP methyl ester carboxylesterase
VDDFTSRDGLRISYEVWEGNRGSHTADLPLVFMHHGFMASANLNWKLPGIVDAVTATGRTVVGIDSRGHGNSEKPHDPAFYGEEKMASDLIQLVDRLRAGSYDLVGYSMGSIVSLIVASSDPRVRRLVIGGVGAGVVELGGVDTRAIPGDLLVQALETDNPITVPHPEASAFRSFADAVGADRFALAAHARALHKSPIPLGKITAPTLVIAGESDPLAERPEVLADAISDSKLQLVSGDHMNALLDPRFPGSIVDFIS